MQPRRSVAGSSSTHRQSARTSLLGDRTNLTAGSPRSSNATQRGKRRSLPGASKAEQRVIKAFEEANRIIATQLAGGDDDTPPQSGSPYNIHALLQSFVGRKKTALTAAAKGRRSSVAGNAVTALMTDENGTWDPLEIDWGLFNDWPEGLRHEEREMKQYYKYLKFIHLEHETKIRFVTEIVDDLEADPPREAIVYTPQDVKDREAQMYAAKAQLKEAKQVVRTLRSEVDAIADRVAGPFESLTASCAEAKALVDECVDLELELVKLRSEGGGAATAEGTVTELDVEEMDLETLPPVGTLTTTEAERFCERQEEELVTLEESNVHLDTLMTRLRSDAKAAIKDVDRLSSEKNAAERAAREAEELGVGGRKRDKEVERACASHSATLTLLKSLLGLRRIEAPTDSRLNLVYVSSTDGCELGLALQFDRPGGRLASVELQHPTQPTTVLPPPSTSSEGQREFATLLKAIKANDVAAVVMEGWDWVERKGRELVDSTAGV